MLNQWQTVDPAEMAPETKGEKGKRSKKELSVDQTRIRTVMVQSLWDCSKITALYPCDFMGTARAPCSNLAIAVRGS